MTTTDDHLQAKHVAWCFIYTAIFSPTSVEISLFIIIYRWGSSTGRASDAHWLSKTTWVTVDPPFEPSWSLIPASMLFPCLFLCVCMHVCSMKYGHAYFPTCIVYVGEVRIHMCMCVGRSPKLMLRITPYGSSAFTHWGRGSQSQSLLLWPTC